MNPKAGNLMKHEFGMSLDVAELIPNLSFVTVGIVQLKSSLTP